MTLLRRAVRRDDNEDAIVLALKACGCLVAPLSAAGIPDLLVYSPHLNEIVLIEVKRAQGKRVRRLAAKMRLRETQQKFHAEWRAAGARVHVCASISDALRAVGAPGVGPDPVDGSEQVSMFNDERRSAPRR